MCSGEWCKGEWCVEGVVYRGEWCVEGSGVYAVTLRVCQVDLTAN